MKRFIEGEPRSQATLLPGYLDDYIAEDNPVRAVDAFVDELELKTLGLKAPIRRSPGARRITRRYCLSSTSTVI
jgi:transposase